MSREKEDIICVHCGKELVSANTIFMPTTDPKINDTYCNDCFNNYVAGTSKIDEYINNFEEINSFEATVGRDLLTTLKQIDPYDFERFIADLWEERGWETEVTSGSRDGGIDIIAMKDDVFSEKQVIQAKRYSGSVSVKEIREYAYLQRSDVDSR